jgi:Holliday junction resolvase
MGMMSKRKGAAGEREWAALCRENGFAGVRRAGQLYQTGAEIADCVGLDGVHQEIKRCEKLNIYKAMEQSTRDAAGAGLDEMPIVAHRQNRREWLVTMRACDWFTLYRGYLETCIPF